MQIPRFNIRRLARTIWRPANLPTVIAVAMVIVGGVFADYQNRQIYGERLRNEVLNEVGLIRAKLEGNINGNIQLVRGLVATLSTEPDMTQARFAELAKSLLRDRSQLTHIAAAPDFVVSMVYPLRGNARALGLDYRNNPDQREAALRARDENELVLAGPVNLVQGGEGFVARFPVFAGEGTKRHFWGIVSAVVDEELLYRQSGLFEPDLALDIAVTGKDALGKRGETFFGSSSILDRHPVTARVSLPSGSWQIAAVPHGGWDVAPPNTWLLRIAMVLAGALIVVPIVLSGRLLAERQRNVAKLRSREAELSRLSSRLEIALEASKIAVWEMNIDTGALTWDERMRDLYGLAPGDIASYKVWKSTLHPDDAARARRDFSEAVEMTGRYESDFRIVLPDGAMRHIRAIGSVYRDGDGRSRIVGVNWDVTGDVRLNEDLKRAKATTEARNVELEAAKARIEHNALHDALTGLPNRRYLDQILESRAAVQGTRRETAALLHIDLDRFKQINDTLGHAAGDAMLVHAARVLKSNIAADDFVARVGGDEFVILADLDGSDDAARTQAAATLAGRIIEDMSKPVRYEGHECRFGVSVGIALDTDAGDPRKLMMDADIALYRAKGHGRNRYQFFNEALQAEIVETKRVADEVLNGLERGEFIAHYQPQFDALTRDITGVEALVRWQHPEKGLLPPAAFLSIAEELNVVATIDRMVLEQALADFRSWRDEGLGIPRIAVNVSAKRLRDEELIASLEKLDFAPGTISFELVESIFLDDNDELVQWNVDRLKDLGIDIEIDDFGTGYASIVSLLKLKPRRLKIDRQLVMPVTESSAQAGLVRSIVDIGRSLGIEAVAEGVETTRHAGILAELGCHAVQGYAFARPMSSGDLQTFVRSSAWREAS